MSDNVGDRDVADRRLMAQLYTNGFRNADVEDFVTHRVNPMWFLLRVSKNLSTVLGDRDRGRHTGPNYLLQVIYFRVCRTVDMELPRDDYRTICKRNQ